MGVVKVKVVKAVNLMNMDFGLSGKTDAYVTVFAGGQWFQTPVIKDNLNPEWNQEFKAEVADTESAVVFFNVFDADNWTNDAFVGGTAVSLATLNANETKTFELPLLRREKEVGWGTLVVELTAVDFTGLAGVVQSLNEAEKKRSAHVTELTAEVDALKSKLNTLQEASQKLESELHKSHGEKSQLESTIKGIEEQANWKLFNDSPNGIHFTSIATGQNLRINPEAVPNVHGLGGDGVWATWLPEKQADQLYKFKNKQTGGYLRIDPAQKITEAGGAGGKYCVFRVHWVDKAKLIVALESTEFPSQHVGILPTGQAKNPAETGRGIHGQFTVKVHV